MEKLLVKVIKVTSNPTVGNPPLVLRPDFGYGINTQDAAVAWGARKGHTTVFWWVSRQRVYAEMKESVTEQAKAIERKSANLVTLVDAAYQN